MQKQIFKQDKGQAGLTIMLSVLVTIFIIGLLVFIFAIMGDELNTATYTSTTVAFSGNTTGVVNETGTYVNSASVNLRSCSMSITRVGSANETTISSANYTVTGCKIALSTTGLTQYNNTFWNVTGTYTYSADNTATNTMNDTRTALIDVTGWFDIFIVITAMVVLILLTVLIITSIRNSGMIEGQSSPRQVGTA